MGSLANQYISQSYTSLIHLSNDGTASANLVELQDGLGNGLGISVNTQGDISASNSVTTLNLNVMNDTELSGAFNLNTYFTASTPAYTNSTQPFFTDTVFVTGSYQSGNYPPSIADVSVGWLCNGINVTNGVVTAVSQSVSGYYITMAGQSPQIGQSYTFRGRISPNAHIYGGLEISENLIVSGTFDIEGKVVVNDNVRINGNLEISGSQRNTGSLFVSNEISSSTINGIGNVTLFSQSLFSEFTNIENYTSSLRAAFTASGVNTIFTNDITASNIEVRNNLNVVGTLTASKVVTLIESSSIIYSSGSNILGDEISDTQTLIGSVIMSGSQSLTGSIGITGNVVAGGSGTFGGTGSFIGNLTATGNISSSTISGIGNVTAYSQSVSQSILELSQSVSSSTLALSQSISASQNVQDLRLNSIEVSTGSLNQFTASLIVTFVTTSSFNPFTASVNTSISNINSFTSSATNRLNNLEAATASYANSASVAAVDAAQDIKINSLIEFTGSYATTGSNTFVGNQKFSGSVSGTVITLSITSNTASMDLSTGNFFILNLPSSSTIFLNPTNIQTGQTTQLLINQSSPTGSITYPSNILFPTGSDYSASLVANSKDIISLTAFDTTSLYAVSVKSLV
jgi:hypothetical protein